MMSEIRTLLSLELRALYGINRFLHTKDPKEKKRSRGLAVVWVFLILMAFSYVGALVFGLCGLDLTAIVPAYLVMIASLLILIFNLFTAGKRIFEQKGYDILASLPVKSSSIVVSRFLAMYAANLVFAVVIMLPGAAVYGYCRHPHLGFYLTALIGTVLIPAIPLVISTLIGTLILAISSRMKSKNTVQTVLMVLLVVGIMLGSFSMEGVANNMTQEQFASLAQTIGGLIAQIYPPAVWLGNAMVGPDIFSLGLFTLVSLAVNGGAVYLVSRNFQAVSRRLLNTTARHNYKITKLESRSLLKTLWFREAKRYFSSSIYVTNTIIGPILGTVLSVALCFTGVDAIRSALPVAVDIPGLLPFVFGAVFCMMTTTSVAISMEGKQFWVVRSLPIPTKTLLDSKVLLNLSLMLPFYVLSAAAMVIAVKPDLLQLLWLLLIPACMILFVTVFGITVNLKFHSFDWEKEETVVKQSLPAAIGGFAGFLLAVVLGVAVFLTPAQYQLTAKALICLLLLGLTAVLYRKNNTAVLSAL